MGIRGAAPAIRSSALAAAALLLALLVLLPGWASASHAGARSAGIPVSTRVALRAAALSEAARHGDAHPYDIEVVHTTYRKAGRILCGNCESTMIPANALIFLVAMRGHFNCNSCSRPRGGRFGPARVITLQFLDPADLRSVVFGYGGPYPALGRAGTPVRL